MPAWALKKGMEGSYRDLCKNTVCDFNPIFTFNGVFILFVAMMKERLEIINYVHRCE
jgi:hypothetical protein